MKVYILSYGHTSWQNGRLIYHEAVRQQKDVALGFVEWKFAHLLRDIKRVAPDWIFLTGARAFPPQRRSSLVHQLHPTLSGQIFFAV